MMILYSPKHWRSSSLWFLKKDFELKDERWYWRYFQYQFMNTFTIYKNREMISYYPNICLVKMEVGEYQGNGKLMNYLFKVWDLTLFLSRLYHLFFYIIFFFSIYIVSPKTDWKSIISTTTRSTRTISPSFYYAWSI